jgi:hypothetical protein
MIPNKQQFHGYLPGVIPEPTRLPRYIAHNNPWLQKMIDLELHQLAQKKKNN